MPIELTIFILFYLSVIVVKRNGCRAGEGYIKGR